MSLENQNYKINRQVELAMKQMIETQTQLTNLVIQKVTNNNSNGIPLGIQQMIDAHTQIVQMMSRIMDDGNHKQSPYGNGRNKSKLDVEIRPRACKFCGEIGHISKECHEQCPNCETSHPTGECPTTNVTCFLCEGSDHVPVQCCLYPMVEQMNQQLKHGVIQMIDRTQQDRSSKKEVEPEVKPQKTAPSISTKCCYTCGEEGHISSNCTRKRERHHTVVVEYEDHELEALLDLEKPRKKKKCNNMEKRDISQVMCYKCKKSGHYASECPERKKNKSNKHEVGRESSKKDISQVECRECQKLGHYSWDC